MNHKELITNNATREHILNVAKLLGEISAHLIQRAAEQLWLAFVMQEMHSKHWNDEKEEWVGYID